MSLARLRKEPRPAPTWIRIFMAAVEDASLDATEPSRLAYLVARSLVPESKSESRPTWIHRFAVLLDREPMRLRELEREISPEGPLVELTKHWNERVDRVMRGAEVSAVVEGEILTVHRCTPKNTATGPRGCGRPIAFRKTRTGASMPLDPIPSPKGNVALIGKEGEEIAEVISDDRLDAYEGFLYATHYSTCPDGPAFRKDRPKARREPPIRTAADLQNRQIEDWIESHAAAFYWLVKEKHLEGDEAAMAALWKEHAPRMFRHVKEERVRVEARRQVSAKVRERLGLAPRRAAA